MPGDEKWGDIHKQRWILNLPPVKGPEGPHTNRPTCAENCSGRHQADSVLVCAKCQTVAYRVILHEYKWSEGHWFNELVPVAGAPPYVVGQPLRCCGERELVRR